MKILHTADWHLGKTLFGISRLVEQEQALDELTALIKREGIDLLLICGDVFDTFVPKAEAEKLFYDKLTKISAMCKVIAISGNHDDGERLSAPSGLAKACGIELIGGVKAIKTQINGQKLNLAALAYPFVSRVLSLSSGKDNIERVEGLINQATKCFDSGINIFASHLFILGSELSEERELGTAPLLPKSILPSCDYCALGHIHKTQKINDSAHYSGSLLKYSFDDKYDKNFLIFDTDTKKTTQIPIISGKKLISADVLTFNEACFALESNPNAYVKLNYKGSALTPTELKQIKSFNSFAQIIIESKQGEIVSYERMSMSANELFKLFFESKTGKQPDEQMTELFLSLLNDGESADAP